MDDAHRDEDRKVGEESTTLRTLFAGVRYVWHEKIVLGCISLDLFAVLLGGAVALLPVYARDILHVGPLGLGFLRTAPAVGAASMGAVLAYNPLRKKAGDTMLVAVAIFGVATIVFGVSRSFAFSLGALAVAGAADMVSVVIRLTLVQLSTPPAMRGRVSAVNMAFINASNELGEFESGITAALWGAVPAVLVGGIGTCVVVSLWAWLFPELRKLEQLSAVAAVASPSPLASPSSPPPGTEGAPSPRLFGGWTTSFRTIGNDVVTHVVVADGAIQSRSVAKATLRVAAATKEDRNPSIIQRDTQTF